MPTVEQVTRDGRMVWLVVGHGVVAHHQQREQALIAWFLLAAAAGYEGPAPVLRP
jgi:hypothetical protein